MRTKILIACLISLLVLQGGGCTPRQENEPIDFGPSMRTDLVFFFKRDTPPEEVEKFLLYDGLVIPAENGTGHYLPEGMGTGFAVSHRGFEGYGLNFKKDATAEQRLAIKSRIEKSPIIFKVFENIVPSDIKDL
ncbi:MAG: hypothetical protein IPM25_14585 [Chloracidobacterium sp.]|nr:hypothetical protein [Chloracidobacterium sp.]